MALEEYRKKRRFKETPEPAGAPAPRPQGSAFVVQKHDATRLHYDFRLEINGVLPSWAVPKGPSLNPADKRLAMKTEDHPLDYATFEGVIPEGNYGAGPVMVWDIGTYEVEGERPAADQVARGEIKFKLHGKKLRGSWVLVRTRGGDPKREQWLLIKHRDEAADPSWDIERHDGSALTGRSLQEIEEGAPPHAVSAGDLPGARPAKIPSKVEPMLATLSDRPFSNPDWLFELKWDGMRILAFVHNGRVDLQARRGRTVTSQFPELEALPDHLAVKQAVVDGECVVLGENGRPDFSRMQQRMNVARPPRTLLDEAPVVYYVFDILYADGYDLREVPLLARKQFLRRVLRVEGALRYSDHVAGKGEELYEWARQHEVEGIVAKLSRGRYLAGRSPEWMKLKTSHEVDAVVGGFTAPRGSREHFGAVLLGLYDDSGLRFIGSAGTGFDKKTQEAVYAQMEKLIQKECPFATRPQTREKATWIKPALVARIRFTEWTRDGHLRAPVYLGLRTDVDPAECRFDTERPQQGRPASAESDGRRSADPPAAPAEAESAGSLRQELTRGKRETLTVQMGGHDLRLTHVDKIYFPRQKYAKRDLLCYYLDVAPLILPFLKDRPLVLRRFPNGIDGEMFYQKDVGDTAPGWMKTVSIYSEDTRKHIRYAMADDLASLLFLTNLGCIDHDPWSSRAGDLEHPDYVFLDMDPTEETSYATVVEVSKAVYGVLTEIGLKAYLKTSGASGLHIFVPVEPGYAYEQLRAFAEIVMRVAAGRVPELTTFERKVEKRPKGHVFMDFNQFSFGRPLASVYSVRPVDGACVSAPIRPKELTKTLTPQRFTLKTMPARLKKLGDLWGDFWESRQRIEPALGRLKEELAAARQQAAS